MAKRLKREKTNVFEEIITSDEEVYGSIINAEIKLITSADERNALNKRRGEAKKKISDNIIKVEIPSVSKAIPLSERMKVKSASRGILPEFYFIAGKNRKPFLYPSPEIVDRNVGELVEARIRVACMTVEDRDAYRQEIEANEKAKQRNLALDIKEEVKEVPKKATEKVPPLELSSKLANVLNIVPGQLFKGTSVASTTTLVNTNLITDKKKMKDRIKHYNDNVIYKLQKQFFFKWKGLTKETVVKKVRTKEVVDRPVGSFASEKEAKITRDRITVKEFVQDTGVPKTAELVHAYPEKLMKFIPDCNNIYKIKS
mmetsp:Transcript_13370/g.25140  ORF Transcript_13370/g.25140 Transcript_13370/m.25140 type:complete len:314 (+) Transcript_13370:1169-2110(+)